VYTFTIHLDGTRKIYNISDLRRTLVAYFFLSLGHLLATFAWDSCKNVIDKLIVNSSMNPLRIYRNQNWICKIVGFWQ